MSSLSSSVVLGLPSPPSSSRPGGVAVGQLEWEKRGRSSCWPGSHTPASGDQTTQEVRAGLVF